MLATLAVSDFVFFLVAPRLGIRDALLAHFWASLVVRLVAPCALFWAAGRSVVTLSAAAWAAVAVAASSAGLLPAAPRRLSRAALAIVALPATEELFFRHLLARALDDAGFSPWPWLVAVGGIWFTANHMDDMQIMPALTRLARFGQDWNTC